MSMQTLTCLQIAWTFSAYTLAVVVLPWLALRRRFAGYAVEERLLGYFLAGNFYLINMVLALQLLHISNRLTLLLGTLAPFAALYWKEHKDDAGASFRRAQEWLVQLLRGERKLKTELGRVPRPSRTGSARRAARWLRAHGPELFCVLLFVGAVFYEYGLDTIRFYGYKASDVVVHNEWINLMDENQIFREGVYPHGFHCIIYYLEQMAGIPTYVLLRVFSLVETFYIHLALLIPLRALCRSRYMPYLGLTAYMLLPALNFNTYWRFTATLPQEYGMIFIVPAGFFAVRFFQEFSKQLAARDEDAKNRAKRKVRFSLVFFTLSTSLTVAIHFYDTVIVGLFCIGIALACCRQIFDWQYFRRIVSAGLVSILLAALPMVIGLLEGNPLQGSFYWGMNVINGIEIDDTSWDETLESNFLTRIQRETVQSDALQIESDAETDYGAIAAAVMIAGGFLLLLTGVFSFLREREENRYQVFWAVAWLELLLLLLLEAPLLHLPNLMGGNRASEFFNYVQAMLWPLMLDEWLWTLTFGKHRLKLLNTATCGILLLGFGLNVPLHWVRSVCPSFNFESNQAMTCTMNIIRENKPRDWTICSANEERQMIFWKGYHEELITFLQRLEDVGKEDVSITIPTHYVYFYIEKLPIDYYESEYDERGIMRVSEEGASEKLNTDNGLTPYKGTERWVTMSHIYYWAQAFQKLHPDDMEVYYEDEDFVCYRLTQNVDSLYDLAIDYGYNDP